MGLFSRKKVWDEERVQSNKDKMKVLFEQVVEDSQGYNIVYGITQNIKTSNYIIARKTTYLYTSLIIGYRESDMSLVLIQTTPELDGCSDPEIYTMKNLKKAKISQGGYTIYFEGGMMAGYSQFYVADEYDEDYTVYIHQPQAYSNFDAFWKAFVKS